MLCGTRQKILIMNKFCCDQFQSYHQDRGNVGEGSSEREVFPNIQIVKLPEDNFNKSKNLYRYLMVCGFLKSNPPFVNMKYCPFCGTDLFEFYKSDEYINGKQEVFFSFPD